LIRRRIAAGATCALLFTLGGAAAQVSAGSSSTGKRPNILFVLTDDQRWDTIAALGGSQVQTPNLDRLVRRGFSFSNAYCMGSMVGAVCLPSRTMILTGRSLWRIPSNPRAPQAADGIPVLPRVLNEAGYVTFHHGKAGNAFTAGNALFTHNYPSTTHTESASTEHFDRAIEFLRKHDAGRPFFLYLAPPVPHDPRISPAKYRSMYPASSIRLSRNFMAQHPFDNGELKVRDELLAPHPRTPEAMRQHLADYYAVCSQIDDDFGRLMAVLRERGWEDNTIVVYSSDQGLAVGGRHGLMGKQNLYEHVKPPLVIAGPGIRRGSSSALAYLFDLFPTLCDFAGIPVPAEIEGRSLGPIVRGKAKDVRKTLFGAYRDCQRMLRDNRWKLIEYRASGHRNTQLFDLKNDPDELVNLASVPEQASRLKRMRAELQAERARLGDPIQWE
jgi:arylsulfatase A-like enzyme